MPACWLAGGPKGLRTCRPSSRTCPRARRSTPRRPSARSSSPSRSPAPTRPWRSPNSTMYGLSAGLVTSDNLSSKIPARTGPSSRRRILLRRRVPGVLAVTVASAVDRRQIEWSIHRQVTILRQDDNNSPGSARGSSAIRRSSAETTTYPPPTEDPPRRHRGSSAKTARTLRDPRILRGGHEDPPRSDAAPSRVYGRAILTPPELPRQGRVRRRRPPLRCPA